MSIDLVGFIAVVAIAYLLPGPDFLVVTRHSAVSSAAGREAALGAQSGLCLHMAIAAAGLSALLIHSNFALYVVRLLGAAYLIWLGASTLLHSLQTRPPYTSQCAQTEWPRTTERRLSPFREGLLTNLLNPKAFLFFASVLPQFIGTAEDIALQVLLLGLLDIAVGVGYWLIVVSIVSKLSKRRVAGRYRDWWERACGAAFIALGAALVRAGA